MAQVYGIPQYPVYSPLAGLAELYERYTNYQRQKEQDAYAKEKDRETFALKRHELKNQEDHYANTRDYQLSNQAMQGLQIQEQARLHHDKLNWDKDPANPENQYRLGMMKASQQNAASQAALAGSHAALYGEQARDLAANREMMKTFGKMIRDSMSPQTTPQTPMWQLGSYAPLPADETQVGALDAVNGLFKQPTPSTPASPVSSTPAQQPTLSNEELNAILLQQRKDMSGMRGWTGSNWSTFGGVR
jgi:hypothetical protein